MNIEIGQLENLRRAFSTNTAGCVRTCSCGITYYDGNNTYDWEDGELEVLQANKKNISLDYSIETLSFVGREYCVDCGCYVKEAEKIIEFLHYHGRKIADYLTLEKERKQKIADRAPVVK